MLKNFTVLLVTFVVWVSTGLGSGYIQFTQVMDKEVSLGRAIAFSVVGPILVVPVIVNLIFNKVGKVDFDMCVLNCDETQEE